MKLIRLQHILTITVVPYLKLTTKGRTMVNNETKEVMLQLESHWREGNRKKKNFKLQRNNNSKKLTNLHWPLNFTHTINLNYR